MNLSVVALGVSCVYQSSPFILSRYRMNIAKFFSFRTISCNIFSMDKLSISESSFQKCIGSCIRVSSVYDGFFMYSQTIGPFSQEISIEYSVFQNIGNRAIADSSSYSFILHRVVFLNVYSSTNGGAIYKTSGSINMSFCCYELCRSSSGAGNLFYLGILTRVSFVSSTVFNCWTGTNTASYSTYISCLQCTLQFLNSTSNKNKLYSCVIEPTCCQNAVFSFCQYHLGYSSGICHPSDSIYTMSHINIIKNTGTVAFFAFCRSSIRLESCYIFQNIHPKLHYYNAGIYVTCYGDFSYSGITYTTSVKTFPIDFEYPNNCIPQFTVPPYQSKSHRIAKFSSYIVFLVQILF